MHAVSDTLIWTHFRAPLCPGRPLLSPGVGVAYSIKTRSMLFTIASRRRPEGWPSALAHYVQEALLEMRALCENASNVGSKL